MIDTDWPMCECRTHRAAWLEHADGMDREAADELARQGPPLCDECPREAEG